MKIGELAAKVGLSADTLRFYEKIHLLKPARLESGVRSYAQADEERLHLIICLKDSGIPLEDIRAYLRLVDKGPGNEAQRIEILLKSRERLLGMQEKLNRSLALLDKKLKLYGAK